MVDDIVRLCRLNGYVMEDGEIITVSAPVGFLVGNTIFHKIFANPDDSRDVAAMLTDLALPPSVCDDPACPTCGRAAEPEPEFSDDQADGRTVNSDVIW